MLGVFITATIHKQKPSQIVVEIFCRYTFKAVYPSFQARMPTVYVLDMIQALDNMIAIVGLNTIMLQSLFFGVGGIGSPSIGHKHIARIQFRADECIYHGFYNTSQTSDFGDRRFSTVSGDKNTDLFVANASVLGLPATFTRLTGSNATLSLLRVQEIGLVHFHYTFKLLEIQLF